jgi:hypothetical protein
MLSLIIPGSPAYAADERVSRNAIAGTKVDLMGNLLNSRKALLLG